MHCLSRLRLIRQAAGNTPGDEEFSARFDTIEHTLTASYLPDNATPDTKANIPALSRQVGKRAARLTSQHADAGA